MKFRQLIILLLIFLTGESFGQNVPPKPNPPRLVNDFVGGLLNPIEVDMLERKLVAYNDSTSTQIAIVIVNSTQPYDIFDYSLKLGREWGIGQKGKDNGLIILWAVGDRQVRIHTGYGMEGVLPDIYANRIINNIIRPNFQSENYYLGLDKSIDAIIEYASGEHKASPSEDGISIFTVFFIFLLIVIILYTIANKNNRGGGNTSRRVTEETGWPYTTYTGWGRRTGNWSGGGYYGGGGFGGFGGGGFGGGGASGGY